MHNAIHDLFYTAISVGWTWGYKPQITGYNRIEFNHCHNVGQKVLSDMAGVYTLGVQEGTTIRNNLIHDVTKWTYGGFGINLDEGSSNIVVERNVIYNTSSQSLHQHFGWENIIRNNVFAFGEEGIIGLSRGNRMVWPEKRGVDDGSITGGFTFERNILLTEAQPVFLGRLADTTANVDAVMFNSDKNVYWDFNGAEVFAGDGVHGKPGRENLLTDFNFEQLQALGYDRFGIVANPKFRDPKAGDFTLGDDSPALKLGFEPIDLSRVGPRPRDQRDDREPLTQPATAFWGYW